MSSLMRKILLLFIASLMMYMPVMGWKNPMTLPDLEGRSLGDPYMMKYKGYYYLYVSAGDRNIYCWRTKDLVNWSSSYICCTDETTAGAYAPEVIYWNGLFYMCTSPRGTGHYILTSNSPTGPFVHQTGNMGRDIDGSFYVDDDGQWYFYHANNSGIRGCTMPTHLTFGEDVDLRCCITGQWTEGPCLFKRNGLYYLLYTGNHVWTNGYRIDYAISNRGPLAGFTPQSEQNPILIDTETPTHKALGHGTAFVGPDLDTYFFCYHNLQDNKSRRLLNFERIAWNGDKLMMTGPTDWEQDAPLVATTDYFERNEIGAEWDMPEGGQWAIVNQDHLTQAEASAEGKAIFTPCAYDSYTAEFTVRAASKASGLSGALFSYKDAGNYAEALFDGSAGTFEVDEYVDGMLKSSQKTSLPEDFDPTCWHSMRVEKNAKKVKVFIDGMQKFQLNMQETGGQVGYVTHSCAADFAYIAISPYVGGNGILDVSLPIPGMLAANLYAEASGTFSSAAITLPVGHASYLKCRSGNVLTYNVNVQRDNLYNIGIRYQAAGTTQLKISVDGMVVADDVTLPIARNEFVVHTLKDIRLPQGRHQLTIEVVKGMPSIYEYNIKRGVEHPHVMADNFDNGISSEWGYKEGSWSVVDGQLESTGRFGKMLMGGFDDIHLTDYTVECDIIYTGNGTNGGLLFRTTNASTGGADDNPVLGTDFLQGYIFMVGTSSVSLGKHNYGWQVLTSASATFSAYVPHHVKVVVEDANIKCYVDDMERPLINYTDPIPFITGRAGFRVHDTSMRFDNFQLTPKEQDPSAIRMPEEESQTQRARCGLYDLQGRNLSVRPRKGVYIENGKVRVR